MTASTIRKTVHIVNQLESKSSFGLDMSTGEQVFIGSRLCDMLDIRAGDDVEAFVQPNEKNPNVEWYATYVRKLAPAEAPKAEEPAKPPASPIREFLEDGPATTRQVADHLGVTTPDATRRLMQMHALGAVVRGGIRKHASQTKDSHAVWALDVSDLLPNDDEEVTPLEEPLL